MDKNFGPDKPWGEMSQSEKQAYIIRNRQRGKFEELVGNGQVMFLDELTPLLNINDPHRRCYYAGNILETGIDEDQRHWVKLRITGHKVQLHSEEYFMPGFNLYYNSVIKPALYGGDQDNRLAALKELDDIHKSYPDAAYENMEDLPLPSEPMRFYIDDLSVEEFYDHS